MKDAAELSETSKDATMYQTMGWSHTGSCVAFISAGAPRCYRRRKRLRPKFHPNFSPLIPLDRDLENYSFHGRGLGTQNYVIRQALEMFIPLVNTAHNRRSRLSSR